MTRGQIQRLQDLSKCYMPCLEKGLIDGDAVKFIDAWLNFSTENDRMRKSAKAILRRLTHQYRHQIAAIRKNQNATQD